MNKLIAMIIGLFLIIGSVVGYLYFMRMVQVDLTTMETVTPTRMIYSGEVINKDMISVVQIPAARHIEGALTDPDDIIGKRAKIPIGVHEEFLPWKLANLNLVPRGNEEYKSFPIDYLSTINNFVRRGDLVNIWVEYNTPKMAYYNDFGEKVVVAKEDIQLGNVPENVELHPIYVEKILEDIRVAHVLDSNGNEIRDEISNSVLANALNQLSPVKQNEVHMESYRMQPTGKPTHITYIMTPEQHSKYVEALQLGTVKIGFDNPFVVESQMDEEELAK